MLQTGINRLVSFLHGLKWVVFWFVASHGAAVWMAYNDAEPHFTPIPSNQLNVSYATLNKYGNDTSGCPRKPTDTITIMDDPQFSFLTHPRVCDDPPDMLVMTLTAPKNLKERNAIRKSLSSFNANSKHVLKPIFLIGSSGGGLDKLQPQIDSEFAEHGDILQSSMVEGYGKLSYKTNVGFIWTRW